MNNNHHAAAADWAADPVSEPASEPASEPIVGSTAAVAGAAAIGLPAPADFLAEGIPAAPALPAQAAARRSGGARQGQSHAHFIATAAARLQTVQANPAFRALLAEYGYHAADFDAAQALQAAAQDGYTTRQAAMAAKLEAAARARSLLKAARRDYSNFRHIAHASLAEPEAWVALGLRTPVPDSIAGFITVASASYAAAQNRPYVTALTVHGCGPVWLAAAQARILELQAAYAVCDRAAGAARQATAARDAAEAALREWMNRFREIARVALRSHPEVGVGAKL